MKNWKTTSAGITAILAAVAALVAAAGPLLDGDLSTAPDWGEIGIAIGAVLAGVGLLNARDAPPAPIDGPPAPRPLFNPAPYDGGD